VTARPSLEIVHPAIEEYLKGLAPDPDPVLKEMEVLAESRSFPIVGPLVGRLLTLLALAVGARRILELGSGYGYSAYWFARGLPPDGEIVCTEYSEENARRARQFFARGGIRQRITFEVGEALELVERHPGPFDLIFMDIDKESYPEAFPKLLPRLRAGGLLITDNMLWSGAVVRPAADAATRGIQAYTRLLYGSQELSTVILPLRDGVSVSLKR